MRNDATPPIIKTPEQRDLLLAVAECATEPDRELDGIIDRLFHDRPNEGDYHARENCIWRVDNDSGLCVRDDGFARDSFCAARYTASLDAAMSLVPEGYHPSVILRQAIDNLIIALALTDEASHAAFIRQLPAFVSAASLRAKAVNP